MVELRSACGNREISSVTIAVRIVFTVCSASRNDHDHHDNHDHDQDHNHDNHHNDHKDLLDLKDHETVSLTSTSSHASFDTAKVTVATDPTSLQIGSSVSCPV